MSSSTERKQRVLIVEDQPDNRLLVSKVLRRAGYHTLESDRADGLLTLVNRERPDLILMDIGLPGRSGYDAVRELKADRATANIPIVALTAYAMQQDRQQCLSAGCCDYLSKPLDISGLVETVRQHLEGPVTRKPVS